MCIYMYMYVHVHVNTTSDTEQYDIVVIQNSIHISVLTKHNLEPYQANTPNKGQL